MRKSNPQTKIGTCTVRFQGQEVILCPTRLLEDKLIFQDCVSLLKKPEPDDQVFLVPEVKIPGGHVDYFLVSVKGEEIKDFLGIELQTMDTIGTVWPARQMFLSKQGISIKEEELQSKKTFAINWKMTMKTILLQMHHKSGTFESLGKHYVLVLQQTLIDHIKKEFNYDGLKQSDSQNYIHIHSYDLSEKENHFKLFLRSKESTNSAGIAKCLDMNKMPDVTLPSMVSRLCQKMKGKTQLPLF